MSVPEVYSAIAKVSAAMAKEGIGKEKVNVQGNYKFRGVDDVMNALSTHLVSAGLVILPRVVNRQQEVRQSNKGGNLYFTTVLVEFDFVATLDGSKHVVVTCGEAMDSSDKSTNKAMSTAYKYTALS